MICSFEDASNLQFPEAKSLLDDLKRGHTKISEVADMTDLLEPLLIQVVAKRQENQSRPACAMCAAHLRQLIQRSKLALSVLEPEREKHQTVESMKRTGELVTHT